MVMAVEHQHPPQKRIVSPCQLSQDTYDQSFFPRVEELVEDSSENGEGYDRSEQQLRLFGREPESPVGRQTVVLSITGLQKRLSERGWQLSSSEVLIELPSSTPITELGSILNAKGKFRVK